MSDPICNSDSGRFLALCADDEHKAEDVDALTFRTPIPAHTLNEMWIAMNTGDFHTLQKLLNKFNPPMPPTLDELRERIGRSTLLQPQAE